MSGVLLEDGANVSSSSGSAWSTIYGGNAGGAGWTGVNVGASPAPEPVPSLDELAADAKSAKVAFESCRAAWCALIGLLDEQQSRKEALRASWRAAEERLQAEVRARSGGAE